MTDSGSGDDSRLDSLIESFMERQRQGERPTLEEYVARHPDLADAIRDIFPALAVMERFGSGIAADGELGVAPSTPPAVPSRLGDFRILREIGRGGMGIVYEAVQETLGRHVALKVLPPRVPGHDRYLERFRREAQAAARLHHSNIVPVFAVGDDRGTAYYAMQFIHGQSLEAVLQDLRRLRSALPKQGPPALSAASAPVRSLLLGAADPEATLDGAATPPGPPPEVSPPSTAADSPRATEVSGLGSTVRPSHYFRRVAEMGLQVAEALAYAHGQGITHRDIKPSNLMLDAAGTIWLTDFGLAKAEGSPDLTQAGDIVGTLRYMAPEQLEGKAEPRSDLYALGLTLYELLCLQPAFQGENRAELIDVIRHRDPLPPRRLDSTVPTDLETILLKAIAKEPQRRYQNAAELADDLRRFLDDRPVRARRAGWLEHGWRWCRRNRWAASFLALLLCAAVGSLAAAFIFDRERARAEQAAERARRAEKDARRRFRQAKLEEAHARSLTGRPGQRFAALAGLGEALAVARADEWSETDRQRFRNVALRCLVLPDVRVEKTWPAFPQRSGWGQTWDVDRGWTLCLRPGRPGKAGAIVERIADGKVVATLPASSMPWVRLSPDGKYAAIAADSWENLVTLTVWRLDPEAPPVMVLQARAFQTVDFSPDGRSIGYVGDDHRLTLLDLATGKRRSLPAKGKGCTAVAFSPDGRRVACRQLVDSGSRILVWDLAGDKLEASLKTLNASNNVAWHPDGNRLAFANGNFLIVMHDLARREVIGTFRGHQAFGIRLAFDVSGDLLYTNDWHNLLRIWDVRSRVQLMVLPSFGGVVRVGTTPGRILVQGPTDTGDLHMLHVAAPEGLRLQALPRRAWWHNLTPSYDAVHDLTLYGYHDHGNDLGLVVVDGHGNTTLLERPGLFPLGFDRDGALYASSPAGVSRWPCRETAAEIVFGPPRILHDIRARPGRVDLDGDRIAHLLFQRQVLVRRKDGREIAVRLPQAADLGRELALSPDGRHLLTMGRTEDPQGIRVWDTATAKLVAELPSGGFAKAGFSPDGRWLWSAGGERRLWRVDSWIPGPILGGHAMALAPDSSLAAVGEGFEGIRLVALEGDQAKGEIARLHGIGPEKYTPDVFVGGQGALFARNTDDTLLLRWDLSVLRRRLAELELDWDDPLPPLPPPKVKPIRFERGCIDPAIEAQETYERDRPTEAVSLWRKAIALDPDEPFLRRRLAYVLFRGPLEIRDLDEALRLCDQAVALQPSWPMWLRRGEVLQARGDFEAARVEFDKVLAANDRSVDGFIARAGCLERLDQRTRAQADLDRALDIDPEHTLARNLRGRWHREAGREEAALADWRASLGSNHEQPPVQLDLARLLVFGPASVRHPVEARNRLLFVAELYPKGRVNPNRTHLDLLLGAAHFHLMEFPKAEEFLTRPHVQRHGRHAGFAQLLLAMCRQRQGRNDQARNLLETAVTWRNQARLDGPDSREFDRLRREAEDLITPSP